MRPLLLVLPALALTACATPREQCISEASQQSRVLTALVAETRGNLERGYAIEDVQELQTVAATCEAEDSSGNTIYFDCTQQETVTTQRPVAIDLNAESAKLDSLRERLAAVNATRDSAIAQCVAIHPE